MEVAAAATAVTDVATAAATAAAGAEVMDDTTATWGFRGNRRHDRPP
jgi:hypothetical protein